jgi:aminopeptidase N
MLMKSLGLTASLYLITAVPTIYAAGPAPGISEELAQARSASIRDVSYQLSFTVPSDKAERLAAHALIRFTLNQAQEVVLDYAQPAQSIRALSLNGKSEFTASNGHIVIPASSTSAGANEVATDFLAGDESLNRNEEFLYTLFVPARAHLAFPCFDQPDLKARFTLQLVTPAGWQAVSNGRTLTEEPSATGKTTAFAPTEPIPTYLFAFAAGKFQVETAQRAGRTFRIFHRETDAAKVARNRDAIFDLHSTALVWLENYTQIPYPWGKFDFVLIPSFQFGGMEHPGAIFYTSSSLMLDQSATQNQLLARASVIAHETAHMWFGDLVTMRWFNDVWMKEVMANFMAAKIVNPSFPRVNHELRFVLNYHRLAYDIDRTPGTNPIRQPLANLDEAGSLYGAIIYDKAPVVMRQLETLLGESAFRDGLRIYLKRYSFSNATWPNLIEILDPRTPLDLAQWSSVWVEQRARPQIHTTLRTRKGRIAALTLRQSDPLGRGLVWPQRIKVALGYPGRIDWIDADLTTASTNVHAAGRAVPLYVLPNAAGLGYGLFRFDEVSRHYLLAHIEDIPDPLVRGSAWVDLWENLLDGSLTASDFLDTALRALPSETDEQNVQMVLNRVKYAFWKFLPPEQRSARVAALESFLRAGIPRASGASAKSAWFNTFRDIVLTADNLAWLERVWRREEKIEGLPFAETDEIAMATELAVRYIHNATAILEAQAARTRNPDRKAQLEFVMPALSPDPQIREQAFARFRLLKNRRREPWVLESLQYLNHPLREQHARRFIAPALELLREVQATGDIFFATRWLDSTLGGHRSQQAAGAVRNFLAREKALPERLRWTVLSSADDLFRAAQSKRQGSPRP